MRWGPARSAAPKPTWPHNSHRAHVILSDACSGHCALCHGLWDPHPQRLSVWAASVSLGGDMFWKSVSTSWDSGPRLSLNREGQLAPWAPALSILWPAALGLAEQLRGFENKVTTWQLKASRAPSIKFLTRKIVCPFLCNTPLGFFLL